MVSEFTKWTREGGLLNTQLFCCYRTGCIVAAVNQENMYLSMKNKINVGLTVEQDFRVNALKLELEQVTHEKAITIATDLLTALFKKHNEMNILIEQHSIMLFHYKNQEETIKYLISRNQSQ